MASVGVIGRWAARAVLGHVVGTVLLVAAFAPFAPGGWDQVGGPVAVVVGGLGWLVFQAPVVALVGAVQGIVVWWSVRTFGAASRAVPVVAGTAAAGLLTASAIVTAHPRGPDLLAYAGVSVAGGALAGFVTRTDRERGRLTTDSGRTSRP